MIKLWNVVVQMSRRHWTRSCRIWLNCTAVAVLPCSCQTWENPKLPRPRTRYGCCGFAALREVEQVWGVTVSAHSVFSPARMTSESSSSSKGRRGEVASFCCPSHVILFCAGTLSMTSSSLPLNAESCNFLDLLSWTTWRPRPRWLSVKQWTSTTPTMR